jgi:hypothetical protein
MSEILSNLTSDISDAFFKIEVSRVIEREILEQPQGAVRAQQWPLNVLP